MSADQELKELGTALAAQGRAKHPARLRCFFKHASHEIMEVEPGGSETSGHFLHHMKTEDPLRIAKPRDFKGSIVNKFIFNLA